MRMRMTYTVAILVMSALVLGAEEQTAQTDTRRLRVTETFRMPRGDLYLVNADGTLGQNLTKTLADSNHARQPSFSRDCRKIVFLVSSDIYVVHADGSDLRQLMKCECHGFACDARSRNVPYCRIHSPIFSPDGNRVFFNRSFSQRSEEGYESNTTIWVMDADGSNQRPLTDVLEETEYEGDPWSPDGTKFLFQSGEHLYVAEPDGTNLTRLTDPSDASGCVWDKDFYDEGSCNRPSSGRSWSPDGTKILFRSWRTGTGEGEVWVMDADGSNQRQLTYEPSASKTASLAPTGGHPIAWSPDGTRVLFWRGIHWHTYPYPYDIVVMDADGSNERTLATLYGEGWDVLRWTVNGIEFHPGGYAERYFVNGVEFLYDPFNTAFQVSVPVTPAAEWFVMDPDESSVRRTGSEGNDVVCPWY